MGVMEIILELITTQLVCKKNKTHDINQFFIINSINFKIKYP